MYKSIVSTVAILLVFEVGCWMAHWPVGILAFGAAQISCVLMALTPQKKI